MTLSLWSLGIALPWYAGLVMLVITAIGIMVPAAPGYIGTLNVACTYGLALFSVPGHVAAAFSWFGLMHSPVARWAAQPMYAAGWLTSAAIVFSARWWSAACSASRPR